MIPFRKNVAVAIDGGGMRGIIVTRALAMLEEEMKMPVFEIFHLAVGTSTGSIIAAGIATGLSASKMLDLYVEMGRSIFPRTLRSSLFPLTRYRYPAAPLKAALEGSLGDITMGDLWNKDPRIDLVIPTFDLQDNRSLFIKPWKPEYASFPLAKAVQASSTVPTYFPVVDDRYIDGGVGSYANPCYLAAYEARFCLEWDPAETTLISLGTGRDPHTFDTREAGRLYPWQWLDPILGAFLQSADDQQVHLVQTFFDQLDFRRFQVDLTETIDMDDTGKVDQLTAYGFKLGRKILSDNLDPIQKMLPPRISTLKREFTAHSNAWRGSPASDGEKDFAQNAEMDKNDYASALHDLLTLADDAASQPTEKGSTMLSENNPNGMWRGSPAVDDGKGLVQNPEMDKNDYASALQDLLTLADDTTSQPTEKGSTMLYENNAKGIMLWSAHTGVTAAGLAPYDFVASIAWDKTVRNMEFANQCQAAYNADKPFIMVVKPYLWDYPGIGSGGVRTADWQMRWPHFDKDYNCMNIDKQVFIGDPKSGVRRKIAAAVIDLTDMSGNTGTLPSAWLVYSAKYFAWAMEERYKMLWYTLWGNNLLSTYPDDQILPIFLGGDTQGTSIKAVVACNKTSSGFPLPRVAPVAPDANGAHVPYSSKWYYWWCSSFAAPHISTNVSSWVYNGTNATLLKDLDYVSNGNSVTPTPTPTPTTKGARAEIIAILDKYNIK